MDVRKTRFTDERSSSTCPMWTGCRKLMWSTEAVTTVPARVAHGGHGARQIHQVHHLSAQHVAEPVGVVRQGEFHIFGYGFPHRLSRERRLFGRHRRCK